MHDSIIDKTRSLDLDIITYIDKGASDWIKSGNYNSLDEVSIRLSQFKDEIVNSDSLTKNEKTILLTKSDSYMIKATNILDNRAKTDTTIISTKLELQLEADPNNVKMQPAPTYMTPEQKQKYGEIQLKTIDEFMNGVPEEKQDIYEVHNEYYDALASQGLLTQDHITEIRNMIYSGEMSPLALSTYQRKLDNQKVVMNKVKTVKRTQDYIIGDRYIDSSMNNMIKNHPKDELEIRRQGVITKGLLVEAISKALETNQQFDLNGFLSKNLTSFNRNKTKMKPIVYPSDNIDKPIKKTETTPTTIDEFSGFQEYEGTGFIGKKRTTTSLERLKKSLKSTETTPTMIDEFSGF
jgi:hypothetical protein